MSDEVTNVPEPVSTSVPDPAPQAESPVMEQVPVPADPTPVESVPMVETTPALPSEVLHEGGLSPSVASGKEGEPAIAPSEAPPTAVVVETVPVPEVSATSPVQEVPVESTPTPEVSAPAPQTEQASPAPVAPEPVPQVAVPDIPPTPPASPEPPKAPEQAPAPQQPLRTEESNHVENSPTEVPSTPEPVKEPAPTKSEKAEEKFIPPPRSYLLKILTLARAAKQARIRKKVEKLMTLFDKKESVKNDDVEKLLHVSDKAATHYLNILLKEGRITRTGKNSGTKYHKI